MFKLGSREYRNGRRRPNIRKCALVAAAISTLLVAGVVLSGSVFSSARSGLAGTPQPHLKTSTAATAPVASPR